MGPSRPFQPPPQQYAAPAAPPPPPTSSSSPLPPPSFPFWNGASLTPAQTGFSDGPTLASYQQQQQQPQHTGSSSNYGAPFQPPFQAPHSTGGGGYTPAPYQAPHPTGYAPPPTSPLQHYAPPPNNPPPLPSRPAPSSSTSTAPPPAQYTPTTKPTPGQPLLRDGKLLVYPSAGHKCSKCGNTGYKPYVERPGTTDPNHPCRKVSARFRPWAAREGIAELSRVELTIARPWRVRTGTSTRSPSLAPCKSQHKAPPSAPSLPTINDRWPLVPLPLVYANNLLLLLHSSGPRNRTRTSTLPSN